ncbi:MAG: LysR substrate-binding domain-containing protein [Bacteroidota bacterium]|jgi:DNA-binding transcriptional LysR family regulator
MDQLAAMRAFVRVVEAGTFTRAAQSLEIPKPTITKLIQSLETHLHTKLLNRTTRRVTVTPDGAAYYERVVTLLADLDELDGSMTLSQASAKGRLRVDVGASFALLVIIPALPDFHARYPDIQIDLGVTDRPVDLIGENVDCVVRAGELSDQSLVARRIAELPFITCAAPSYLALHGEPRKPSDLERDHHAVNFFHPRTGRTSSFHFVLGEEEIEVKGRHIVAVNDGNAYVAAALSGLGVIQVPLFMVHEHLKTGALRQILPEWTTDAMPVHVVFAPNRHLSTRLRVFVDWIAELFASHPLIRQRIVSGR